MSDDKDGGKHLPTVRKKWYSVNMRYFFPQLSADCFVISFTLRAKTEQEATDLGIQMFDYVAQGVSQEKKVVITPWIADAVEIPEPWSTRLDEKTRKESIEPRATRAVPIPEITAEIIDFPGKRTDPEKDPPKDT